MSEVDDVVDVTNTSGDALGERSGGPYRVRQVAEALGVSPDVIYDAIKAGRLEAYRIGKAVRVPREAFERYRAHVRAAAVTEPPVDGLPVACEAAAVGVA